MNKKIKRLIEPSIRLYLSILVIFTAVTLFFDERFAIAEGIVVLLLCVFAITDQRKRSRSLMEYIDSVTYSAESAKDNTLMNFPLPMVVFKLDDYQIVWANQNFFDICGSRGPRFEARVTDLVPSFSAKWLLEGKSQYPGLAESGGRKYRIHGNIVHSSKQGANPNFMGIAYWLDITEYENIRLTHEASRPVMAMITIDNYDEMVKGLPERARNNVKGEVEDQLSQWTEGKHGFFRSIDRDRYLFVFEERHLPAMIEEKFTVLEKVREIQSASGIKATISIGIGRGAESFQESYQLASLATEMALSRGGDQVVIKNRLNFEFFGGRGTEIEPRTKVKSRVAANALAGLIKSSSQIMVMGHKFADLDTLGGAAGLCCIARKLGRKASIVMDLERNAAERFIELLKSQPEYEGVFITPQEALLKADAGTLLIIVDTSRPEQVEDLALLEACNHIAVIDHHRRTNTYIENPDLIFQEPYASSVCELITELMQEILELSDILRAEAEAMLAGIVLDTKNFSMRTGERTFEAAAVLRRAGADTVEVKRLLQSDIEHTVERYKILQSAQLYKKSIAVAAPDTPQDRIVAAQAADELLNVSGVEASLVAYPTEDGGVFISARSIGDVNVQLIMEKLGGGGNRSAAAAQIPSVGLKDAVNRMFAAIDEYLSD